MRRTATSAAFCVGVFPSSLAEEGGAKRRMRGSIRASQRARLAQAYPSPSVIVATGVAALSWGEGTTMRFGEEVEPIITTSKRQCADRYFPSRSTLSFSFWFISRTLGSGLCCPVVWVVEGGVALALGTEFWSGVLGRVAVVGGVVLLWAYAPVAVKRKALDSNETASAFEIWVIDLLLSDRCKRREAALCSRLYASNCLPSGRLRMRFPVAAKMAFISAGANGGTPGSPTPLGGVSGPGGTM